jgi:prevent-host-death family protein
MWEDPSMKRLGASEARTHLSRMLREVERGASCVITRHGKAVALLVPARPGVSQMAPAQAIARLRAFRRGRVLGKTTIRELIDEGRPADPGIRR